jgi:ribose 5-phosphate isomerase
LLREKVVASSSRRLIIIADESKLVDRLGAHFAVPVEVVQFEWQATERKLKKLGARTTLRLVPTAQPFVTDGGNFIVDCSFGPIEAPASLDQQLNSVVGVVEHGLFLKMTSQAIVAGRRRQRAVKVLGCRAGRWRRSSRATHAAAPAPARPACSPVVLVYICQNRRRTGIGIVGRWAT